MLKKEFGYIAENFSFTSLEPGDIDKENGIIFGLKTGTPRSVPSRF